MTIGLVGRKCGMSRVFIESGESVPVSVIEIQPNVITQVKTTEKDGYSAYQVTTGERRASRVNKAMAGHFAKANTTAGRGLWEFTSSAELMAEKNITPGQALLADVFAAGQFVDVTGTTKGKGYAGTVKRYHFRTQDATHGNSRSHRSLGSTGQNQTPGKVFKGKKMPGHLGVVQRTIQNLEIVRVDVERNLILIKGAIPGAPAGDVFINLSVKRRAVEK
jgi:large subunit ribosomal protein L3